MNRIYTTPRLVILALILLFVATGVEAGAEELSGLSGKVVDVEGNPLAGFTFAVQPVEQHNGHLIAEPDVPDSASKGETDSAGAFAISDIQPGLVQLIALPDIPIDLFEKFDPEKFDPEAEIPQELMRRDIMEPDKRIYAIQFGSVTLL